MDKKLIHLFGASGSGTTTLGRFISEKTGFFFLDTDDYFWEKTDPPFTTKREPAERLARIRRDLSAHGNAVLSGALTGWGDVLIPLFTLAIRVEVPAELRLERLKRRERERYGSRIEAGGDMAELHGKFMEWAVAYEEGGPDIRSRRRLDEWQKQLTCPLVTVDGSLPVEKNFEIIAGLL